MLQPRICLRSLPMRSRALQLRQPLIRTYASTTVSSTNDAPNLAEVTASFEAPPSLKDDPASSQMFKYKPRTPGLRHRQRPVNDHLWKGRPLLKLTFPRKGQHIGGRNNTGRLTMRHRGGGHKRRIRMVDFARWDDGEQLVERIEHDPGRSAHIALLTHKATGVQTYIVAAEGMRAGDTVQSYRKGLPQELIDSMGGQIDPAIVAAKTAWRGNCLPLRMVPPGTYVYNIGLNHLKGGIMCRSAGTFGQVVGNQSETNARKANLYTHVRLQSGEVRRIHKDACATIGVASNGNHNKETLGKAGRSRWLGIRPTVRGLAMNANEHPHGGGRGKSKGNRHPVSIWGRTLAKSGFKTRGKHKSDSHVVIPRPRNQGKRRNKKT